MLSRRKKNNTHVHKNVLVVVMYMFYLTTGPRELVEANRYYDKTPPSGHNCFPCC